MITAQPRPDWAPLPRPGCRDVEFRVLLNRDGLAIANLRFGPDATIDPHDASFDIDVICLAGGGMMSVDDTSVPIRAGETAHWPRGCIHCLWTTGETMETIMVERHKSTSVETSR